MLSDLKSIGIRLVKMRTTVISPADILSTYKCKQEGLRRWLHN